ncbi:MAG: glutaredoxin 3 [Pseudomonadota bacterium]
MSPVTIYTKPMCPFCVRAMVLLADKGAEVTEISAAYDAEKRAEMLSRSNGKMTYPQIFIGETHVGGCDDLFALDQAGKLDALLGG